MLARRFCRITWRQSYEVEWTTLIDLINSRSRGNTLGISSAVVLGSRRRLSLMRTRPALGEKTQSCGDQCHFLSKHFCLEHSCLSWPHIHETTIMRLPGCSRYLYAIPFFPHVRCHSAISVFRSLKLPTRVLSITGIYVSLSMEKHDPQWFHTSFHHYYFGSYPSVFLLIQYVGDGQSCTRQRGDYQRCINEAKS